MKTRWKPVVCVLVYWGHKLEYTGRTADWLKGGTYYYKCKRCGTIKTATPYLGGN